jgi:2-polyprenyl-3-methyl-5-hydroxy-6-metoxy-1,4-benzoquinol methylase
MDDSQSPGHPLHQPDLCPQAGGSKREIATSISRLYASRFMRSYSYWKVRTDPVYPASFAILEQAGDAPLTDIGCGAGLFAFYLKSRGFKSPVWGLDVDPTKIDDARKIAPAHWPDLHFALADMAAWTAADHQGHVTLLDVLQYLPEPEQTQLLTRAASCLTAPHHRLILRGGLQDNSWRWQVTRFTDHAARWIGWMARSPQQHPKKEALRSLLESLGLEVTLTPLWGKTPFNNYLISARKP